MVQDSLFLQALASRNQSRPPVWLMRQAGRYLPSYQKLRQKYSLRELFFSPSLAAEVTLLPVQELQVDAAILFSDITVIALALGFSLDFQEGPVIFPLLENPSDIDRLELLSPKEALSSIFQAIELIPSHIPLIGFCGGPFTVASFLIEKHSGGDLPKTKQWLYRDPKSFHRLLEKITEASIEYLRLQVASGVHAIQIFDSWAHVLSEEHFEEVCLSYWNRLLQAVDVPGIVFAKSNAFRIERIQKIKPAAISIDWQLPIALARKQTHLALQGNLDPDLLFAPLEEVRSKTLELLDSMRQDPAFIVNLGHGVKPNTPVEAVRALISTVQEYAP